MARLRSHYESLGARIPRRALRAAGLAAALAILVWVAFRSRSLVPAVARLGHPEASWLLLAVVAQVASLAAYALIVRQLLAVGGTVARVSALVRATLAGIAMGASLPGGQVASAAYWYKRLRGEGASRSLTAFAMVGAMVAGVVSLAALFVAGIAAAGADGPLAAARTPILAGCAALVLVGVVARRRAVRVFAPLVRIVAPGLDGYSPDRRRLASVTVLAFGNWVFDCACLCAALAALHADVSARSILLAYTLAQLVACVPLLPGGGGTVEASLVLTFAAFGHTSASVVAGVLLFRVISCWGLVPVGWAAVALERRPVLLRRPAFA